MQTVTSANTSINAKKFPVLFDRVSAFFGWEYGTVNVDLGGGKYENTTEYLRNRGVESMVIDPYNRPEHENRTLEDYVAARGGADTVTLSNVLNVIDCPLEVSRVVNSEAWHLLKTGGRLYISVYEGDGSSVGRYTGKDQYQANLKVHMYVHYLGAPQWDNVGIQRGLISATKVGD